MRPTTAGNRLVMEKVKTYPPPSRLRHCASRWNRRKTENIPVIALVPALFAASYAYNIICRAGGNRSAGEQHTSASTRPAGNGFSIKSASTHKAPMCSITRRPVAASTLCRWPRRPRTAIIKRRSMAATRIAIHSITPPFANFPNESGAEITWTVMAANRSVAPGWREFFC
jgi:hypothetical protein